jgi:hypothetical protein
LGAFQTNTIISATVRSDQAAGKKFRQFENEGLPIFAGVNAFSLAKHDYRTTHSGIPGSRYQEALQFGNSALFMRTV